MLYDVIILELSTFFHHDYMTVTCIICYVTVCDCYDYDITLNSNPK